MLRVRPYKAKKIIINNNNNNKRSQLAGKERSPGKAHDDVWSPKTLSVKTVRYEEERLLEVYTDEAYDKRVKDINQKINELITELQK